MLEEKRRIIEVHLRLFSFRIADYRDNKRIQSILRHSLQPVENADALFSFHLSEEWDQMENVDGNQGNGETDS